VVSQLWVWQEGLLAKKGYCLTTTQLLEGWLVDAIMRIDGTPLVTPALRLRLTGDTPMSSWVDDLTKTSIPAVQFIAIGSLAPKSCPAVSQVGGWANTS
jgi:hypothetical protein